MYCLGGPGGSFAEGLDRSGFGLQRSPEVLKELLEPEPVLPLYMLPSREVGINILPYCARATLKSDEHQVLLWRKCASSYPCRGGLQMRSGSSYLMKLPVLVTEQTWMNLHSALPQCLNASLFFRWALFLMQGQIALLCLATLTWRSRCPSFSHWKAGTRKLIQWPSLHHVFVTIFPVPALHLGL